MWPKPFEIDIFDYINNLMSVYYRKAIINTPIKVGATAHRDWLKRKR